MIKKKKINSLYIHIPFCRSICPYCDFSKLLLTTPFVDKYLDALIYELETLKINHKLKTIYIGGGTPSCVNLTKLLDKLDKYISKDTEFTIEGNVLDFNESLLKLYKLHKVNRISLGIQALNDDILKVLGREHCKNEAIDKVKLIAKYIKNINVDLIYGFNELTNKALKEELKEYIKLPIKHISTYSLEIHEGTMFFNDKRKDMDDALVRKQFDLIYKFLTKNKFNRYEISNFSKKDYESKHNLTYWNDEEYYGIGLSASSYMNGYRCSNTKSINKYLDKKFISSKEKITLEEDKKYFYMLKLRLKDGIDLKEYKNKYHSSLLKEKKEINKLIKQKLLVLKDGKLITTYQGSMLLDIILRELF